MPNLAWELLPLGLKLSQPQEGSRDASRTWRLSKRARRESTSLISAWCRQKFGRTVESSAPTRFVGRPNPCSASTVVIVHRYPRHSRLIHSAIFLNAMTRARQDQFLMFIEKSRGMVDVKEFVLSARRVGDDFYISRLVWKLRSHGTLQA